MSKPKRIKKIAHLTDQQNHWLNYYYGMTMFEPMYLDELANKTMTFNEAAKANIQWYEDHMHDAFSHISSNVPYDGDAL